MILVCLNHCQDKRVQNILVVDHCRPWPECDHRWRCTHSKSSSHSRPHWLEYLWEVHYDSIHATGCFKNLTAWILQHVFDLWSIQKNIYSFIKSVFMSAVHLMIKTRNSVTIWTRPWIKMNTRLAVVVNLWAGWVWGIILKLFGSDRSPRRGNVVCASVRPSVTLFKRTLKMSYREFKQASNQVGR